VRAISYRQIASPEVEITSEAPGAAEVAISPCVVRLMTGDCVPPAGLRTSNTALGLWNVTTDLVPGGSGSVSR
jgi:hypothetical protein